MNELALSPTPDTGRASSAVGLPPSNEPSHGHLLESALAEAVQSLTGHVLLVEDSDDDAMVFLMAARKSETNANVHRTSRAAETLSLLDEVTPSLITLDIDLHTESGLDLLRTIRSMKSLRSVPIVMLSGSDSECDVQRAYELGANSYLRKPQGYDEYLDSVRSMLTYWLDKNYASPPARPCSSRVWLG